MSRKRQAASMLRHGASPHWVITAWQKKQAAKAQPMVEVTREARAIVEKRLGWLRPIEHNVQSCADWHSQILPPGADPLGGGVLCISVTPPPKGPHKQDQATPQMTSPS